MSVPLLSATHVVFTPPADERLLGIGATNVVRAFDTLLIGPCRRDPAEHAQARSAWWPSTEDFDQLHKPDIRWNPPIVVWVSPSIAEQVNLWRTCSLLRHLGVATSDVLLIELDAPPEGGTPEDPPPPFDGTSSVADYPDDLLLDRLRTAQAWSRERYDRAVHLWDQYVSADPSRFAKSCIQGVESFPKLASLWTYLSAFFPRRDLHGTLRLSRFDELLLTILSDDWLTPLKVYAHKSQAGEELWRWLSTTGDLFTAHRLTQWAQHPSGAVEQAPGPKPSAQHPLQSSVYRLTDTGKRLLKEGLPELPDAPPLAVGGIDMYAPSSPWVLAAGAEIVRLELT